MFKCVPFLCFDDAMWRFIQLLLNTHDKRLCERCVSSNSKQSLIMRVLLTNICLGTNDVKSVFRQWLRWCILLRPKFEITFCGCPNWSAIPAYPEPALRKKLYSCNFNSILQAKPCLYLHVRNAENAYENNQELFCKQHIHAFCVTVQNC